MEKIIASGAEAVLIHKDNFLIKRRINKNYRLPVLDEKLRKLRTRSEAKIIEKLQGKINVPKIISVDENSKEIEMEFIRGKKLSDNLDNFDLKKQEEICKQIGQEVGKMHDLDIVHSDLTTSNMILVEDLKGKNNTCNCCKDVKDLPFNKISSKVILIDFGLGFQNAKVEDKAVDIHLFRQALESKHFKDWENLFSSFIQGYNPKDKAKILKQLDKVEARGRYKH